MKKGYRYETHLHTAEVSACGFSTAEEHVKAHFKSGYSGIVITDHFFNGNTTVNPNLPWAKKVKAFCKGYENAKMAAKGLDFDVFFALEYTYHGTDFLTYGIDESFLLAHEDLLEWPIEKYFDQVHEAGGFIIHAHPFRQEFYIPKIRLFTDYIDAVEVENLGNAKQEYNQQAYDYAKSHNFPMTKGTDLHDIRKIVGGGMVFEKRPNDIFEMIQMIVSGSGSSFERSI